MEANVYVHDKNKYLIRRTGVLVVVVVYCGFFGRLTLCDEIKPPYRRTARWYSVRVLS